MFGHWLPNLPVVRLPFLRILFSYIARVLVQCHDHESKACSSRSVLCQTKTLNDNDVRPQNPRTTPHGEGERSEVSKQDKTDTQNTGQTTCKQNSDNMATAGFHCKRCIASETVPSYKQKTTQASRKTILSGGAPRSAMNLAGTWILGDRPV